MTRNHGGQGETWMRLGDLERRVMEILWAQLHSKLTARQVADDLPGYAYTTVLTVLDRLERKGLVHRERGGRAHRYSGSGESGGIHRWAHA